MIYSFYGYKGGVGRTLALVHAASLLASTRAQTKARVLVIDLDLEAPGSIETLLPPQDKQLPQVGFSEILHEYLDGSYDADWIRSQIEEHVYTAAESLFVLRSAGRGADTFLETTRSLARAYKLGFFKQFHDACDAYEYVLVDCRTGLADIATAATIILGDVLVACFRPNRANFGIGQMVHHFLARHRWTKSDRRARIVPLLTPRPAYYSVEAREWAKKFRDEFFGPHEIIQVPFDPVLQVGDRLLIPTGSVTMRGYGGGVDDLCVTGDDELDLDAPLVGAYVALVDRMAAFNTARDIVAAQQAEVKAYAEKRYQDGLAFLFQIIRSEPARRDHWKAILARYEEYVQTDPKLREKLREFLDAALADSTDAIQTEHGRAWAHVLRARMFGVARPEEASEDCDKAVSLSAAFDDNELVGLARFTKAMAVKRTGGSLTEIDASVRQENRYAVIFGNLDAAMEALGPTAPSLILRADTLRDLHQYEEAVHSYDEAAKLAKVPGEALISAGKTLEWIGRYGEALQRFRAAYECTIDEDLYRRYAYLLGALEQFDEATRVVYRWTEVRRSPAAYAARINIKLAEGKTKEAEVALHEMFTMGMKITRTLWVAFALRTKNFADAARIANEDRADVRLYMRSLAQLAIGDPIPSKAMNYRDVEEAPPILIASILSGQRHTGPLRVSGDAPQSAKWQAMFELAEVLVAARRGSKAELETFINTTTADPENALYLRNQLELRLPYDVCIGAPQTIEPPLVGAMTRIFAAWEAIRPKALSNYPAFEFRRQELSA